MGFFDKLQSKIELYRLEQRYTRRKRRTTFISEAQYIDGEYVYHGSHSKPNTPDRSSKAPTNVRVYDFGDDSARRPVGARM